MKSMFELLFRGTTALKTHKQIVSLCLFGQILLKSTKLYLKLENILTYSKWHGVFKIVLKTTITSFNKASDKSQG